jgi:hypothetical protein
MRMRGNPGLGQQFSIQRESGDLFAARRGYIFR